MHAEDSPHDPLQGANLPNKCAFHHKNSTICCMSSRCRTSRKDPNDDAPTHEDPIQDVPRKPRDYDGDVVSGGGCAGDMGILAKAQSVVSRFSGGGSRHTTSGHGGRRSLGSVDEVVRVRDFAVEGKLEDEDEITVISFADKRG